MQDNIVYKIGDYLMSLDLENPTPFYQVKSIEETSEGTNLWLNSIQMKNDGSWGCTWTSLLFLEKNYVRVSESTIKVLFGDMNAETKKIN